MERYDSSKRLVKFKISGPTHKQLKGLAQWSSILATVLGFDPQKIRSKRAASIKVAIAAVIKRRHNVLGRLWHENLIKQSDFVLTSRCPPTACFADFAELPPQQTGCRPLLRVCYRRNLCPFCWQRMITKPCADLFFDLLWPDTFTARLGGIPIARVGVQLIQEERHYPSTCSKDDAEILSLQGAEHKRRIPGYVMGAQSLITLIPQDQEVLVRRTLLGLVDRERVPDKLRKNLYRVSARYIWEPCENLTEVALAIGEACAYPAEYYSEDLAQEPVLERFLASSILLGRQVHLRAFSGILHQQCRPDLVSELTGRGLSEPQARDLLERLNDKSTNPRAAAPARRAYPCTRA